MYTQEEIDCAKGLQKEICIFWNEKAEEICKDRAVRVGKLKSNTTAIQGAIYASWTLHKSNLLELKADKRREDLKSVYKDEVTLSQVLSAVDRNIDGMKTAYAVVTTTYSTASNAPNAVEVEQDLNDGMQELRRAQDALSKAIDRRSIDIQLSEQEKPLVAISPEQLSQDHVQQLAISIKLESQDVNFHPDS